VNKPLPASNHPPLVGRRQLVDFAVNKLKEENGRKTTTKKNVVSQLLRTKT
jgi:hypothetical protein